MYDILIYEVNVWLNTKIETDRLIIGEGCIDDYVKIHEYDFNELQNINGRINFIKTNPSEVRNWFNNDINAWYEKIAFDNHYNFVVYLKEENVPIADIGFDRNDPSINGIEISCWLHPNYWGNGYMKEALIGTMDYIFTQGFDNIICGYIDNNIRSKRLCEKLGFLDYKIDEEFDTNYGKTKAYIKRMPKEKFYELYKKDLVELLNQKNR